MATRRPAAHTAVRRTLPGGSGAQHSNIQRNLNINKLIDAGKNNFNHPTGGGSFPGYNTGAGIAAVRKLIAEQPRCEAYRFTAGAATTTQVNGIQLPGDARVFLGLIFTTFAGISDTFSLSINNNLIIKNGSCQLHAMNNSASIKDGYFPYPQPLTGVDLIEITINSIPGQVGAVQLAFI